MASAPSSPPAVFAAVDTTDLAAAEALATKLAAQPGLGIKLGLEFFCAHGGAGVLLLETEIFLNDLHRLLIDLLLLVVLKLLNFIQATFGIDALAVLVDGLALLVGLLLPHSEDVLQALECHRHNAGILGI